MVEEIGALDFESEVVLTRSPDSVGSFVVVVKR